MSRREKDDRRRMAKKVRECEEAGEEEEFSLCEKRQHSSDARYPGIKDFQKTLL